MKSCLFSQKIDPASIRDFFGTTSDSSKTSDSAYILFYQAVDVNAAGGGGPVGPPTTTAAPTSFSSASANTTATGSAFSPVSSCSSGSTQYQSAAATSGNASVAR